MICKSCVRALVAGRLLSSSAQSRVQKAVLPSCPALNSQVSRPTSLRPFTTTPFSPFCTTIPRHSAPDPPPEATPTTVEAATSPSAKTPQPPPSVGGPEKPDFLNAAETEIWDRLTNEFNPKELYVRDISGGCGSMYGIEIASEKFRGLGMLKQQKLVNGVLGDWLKEWHGVQLKTKVP